MSILRDEDFYYQYEQNGGTVEMPKEVFWELYNDSKEEIERLKTELQDTKEHLGEYLHEQEEENKKLNNILNEAINYTTKQMEKYEGYDRDFEIVLSNIVVILGSDKE